MVVFDLKRLPYSSQTLKPFFGGLANAQGSLRLLAIHGLPATTRVQQMRWPVSRSLEQLPNPLLTVVPIAGGAFNRTATWHGIQKDLTGILTAGQTYTTGAWVRTNTASVQTFQITFQYNDGATNYRPAGRSTSVDNSRWVFVTGTFLMPSNVTSAARW